MTAYNTTNVDVLGVVILTRHGDHTGLFADASSYAMTAPELTPFGETQAYSLGAIMRSRYISRQSALCVRAMSENIYKNSDVKFKADAGSNGGEVILDTALAVAQGLYPPTRESNEVLADGTVIVSPMSGYQYVGVESVEPDNDISLDGWTDCKNFDTSKAEKLASAEYTAKAAQSAPFLDSIKDMLGGRPTDFKYMWDIYNYMSILNIHSKPFRLSMTPHILGTTRDLANWHQYGIYSDENPTHISNIGGRVVIPEILNGIQRIANTSDPLGMLFLASDYRSIISLFRLLGVTKNQPALAGVANHMGAISLEVVRPSNSTSMAPSDLYVRFNFKNGTSNGDFVPYTMLGRPVGKYDVPLDEFTSSISEWGVRTLVQWCNLCGVTDARGCDMVSIAQENIAALTSHRYAFNPLASGFIGAAAAFVLATVIIASMILLGCLSWRSRGGNRRKSTASSRLSAIVPGLSPRKRHSGGSGGGDTESQQAVNHDMGAFELRDDVSVLSHSPSLAEKITHS